MMRSRMSLAAVLILFVLMPLGCITGSELHTAEEKAAIGAVTSYTPHDISLAYALAMALRKSGYPEDDIREYVFESDDKGWECFYDEEWHTWLLEFSWKYSNEVVFFSFAYDSDTGVISGANANGTCLLAHLNDNCVDCVCTAH